MDTFDLRGMAPPQPIERVLQEVDDRPAGDTFAVILPHEPVPLYDFLKRLGCTWRGEPVEGGYRVTITTAA